MGCAPDSGISVAGCFDSVVNLLKWWTTTITQPFGKNGEKGADFGVPYNTPIGSISGGTVIYAGLPPDSQVPGQTSIGYVVQVKTPDGRVLHYQHLKSKNVQAGQPIRVGDVIGNSGGCAQGSTPSHCIKDNESKGPHIEVREAPFKQGTSLWNYAWENPVPYIQKLTGGNVNGPPGNPAQAVSDTVGGWISALQPIGVSWGEHIAIFLLALVLIILGLYLIAERQVNQVASTAVKAVAA